MKLLAVVVMGMMWALAKLCMERGAGLFEIIFFRNFCAFIPLLIFIIPTSGLRILRTTRPLSHLARAGIGVSGMMCGFAALRLMPLTEFTAISFSAPLIITALSAPVLREKVGLHRWIAVVIGFVGVLLMLRPDPTNVSFLGGLLALGLALGTAGAGLTIRQLGTTEAGPTIVFYFTLACTVVGAIGLPFVWSTPDLTTLALLVGVGFTGGIGQLLLTQAYRVAPVAAIAPFDYAALLWNGLLGFLIWHETPRGAVVLGGAIVVCSGLYILFRETTLRRRRSARPPA